MGVLVLSLLVLGGGIWLSHRAATTDCKRFLERLVIALEALLAGLVGSLWRTTSSPAPPPSALAIRFKSVLAGEI